MRKPRLFFKKFYLAIIMLFLYIPIVVMIAQSFNAGKSRAKWEGFSFRWYAELFQDRSIMQALQVTIAVAGIDAVIATNTTITRDRIQGMPNCTETGGLSGAPLRERSTEVVRLIADHVQGALPIIASGGVMTPQDAVEKMEAGAKLLQLYTGFIYSGPALIAECSEAVARWRAAQKA